MERIWMVPLVVACFNAVAYGNPFISAPNSDLESFHTFHSTESSHYKTLTLASDSQTLYIGAQDTVFGQTTGDITLPAFSPVKWPVLKDDSCRTLPQSKNGEKCYNLIQIVQPLNETHIVICGTNYLAPKNKLLVKQNGNGEYSLFEDDTISTTLCSFDPTDSITSLMVPSGNGGNIFSTPRSELHAKISLVKTMPESLLMSNENMQGDISTIVASFTAEDTAFSQTMSKVYFVSDEKTGGTGVPVLAPTITQVCANDIGGRKILPNMWTSLLKVRLQCQTEDKYPLQFDLVTDMVTGRDGIVYGTFMTRHDTSRTNAVCSFRLSDVQKAFNTADFWDTQEEPYKAVKAPSGTLRPGMCAFPGMIPGNPTASTSKDFPSTHLTFMREHNLVVDVVKPAFPPSKSGSTNPITRGPLLIKSGKKFTKIAVEQVTGLDGSTYDVIFVGKEDGFIHKFVSIAKKDSVETVELAQYRPTSYAIISMKLSQDLGQLYVGTDKGVHQFSTASCAAYTKSCEFCDPCRMCILSRDPSCAWDKVLKECVSITDDKTNLLQDVYHGDAATQCGELDPPTTILRKVGEGETEILGDVIKNPSIIYTWYKVKDASTKQKITNKNGKYRMTMDGQLEVKNFDSSEDSAKYECEYTANSATVNISTYDVKPVTYVPTISPPLVTVSPRISGPNTDPNQKDLTTRTPVTGVTNTTKSTTAYAIAGSTVWVILGVVFGVLVLIILLAGLVFYRRKRKYTTGNNVASKELEHVALDGNGLPSNQVNATNNNNRIMRNQSEFDDRSSRPLLYSRQQSPEYSDPETDLAERPSSSQRNAKSLDNILDGRDDLEYIDDDTASDKGPARQNSLRAPSGRQRVPPARTKSMPGSNLYVMFGGKKLMCTTLQRNRQGTWTIQVEPNQSGMSDLAPEQDEVIDIINENDSVDNQSSNVPEADSVTEMKDARKAFFEADSSKPNADRSPHVVQYITSTPNNSYITSKPRIAPKPFHLISSDNKNETITEQPSRGSLRSFGQNSSEEHDSDSTVKGSNMTLKPEETHFEQHSEVPTKEPTSDVPTAGPSGKKRKNKPAKASRNTNPHTSTGSFNSSIKSLDGSSASSDADDQLHGRDKNNKSRMRGTPLDSPSKQSRTSQGSSSSGDYRSARSSVISEPSHDQR